MDPSPGYLTTEFWSTQLLHLLTLVITLSTLTGHSQFDGKGVQELVPAAALIMSGLAQAYYNHSRAHVKTASLKAAADVLTTQAVVTANTTTDGIETDSL